MPVRKVAAAVLLFSGQVLAAEIEPHWSGLPIWGVEAEARGYQIPLPFGVGVTAYSARQPVNIQDLQLGRNREPPVSVANFLQIDRVDTSQKNVSAKLDVLVFPFLDVYAILGRTTGTTQGVIEVPADAGLGIIGPRQLQLNASFNGPTYGAGFTLQGGGKVNEWRDLTFLVVADWNRTRTNLSFENETLVAETKPVATVFSGRLGLHATLSPGMGGAVWIGGMHQRIQQTVAGSVADTDLQFVVVQSPTKPWNTLLGGLIDFGRNGYVLLEGGLGARKSILAAAVYRF
ncbi:hypothetical protein DSM104443_00298 [Usitatibacter rugosus]|uniref:Outer membrane beta-barrel porin/alpha-amylase n=1 Tax=Usitatibacter rugosus TaxID=2732067 RepID=A0A6M4GPX1_9PROT|nr:hypothetical protein [Usitatibacter rugosus]QJR09261.1 hypothetical protein DSM104443_00298 [Usitatibacter rugosus]